MWLALTYLTSPDGEIKYPFVGFYGPIVRLDVVVENDTLNDSKPNASPKIGVR